MRKNRYIWIAALLLLLALAGCGGAEGEGTEHRTRLLTVATPAPGEEADRLRIASQAAHPALMACREDGSFAPRDTVTRAEAAELLAAMLDGLPEGTAVFSDMDAKDGSCAAASALTEAGIFPEEGDLFRPEEELTRSELSAVLRHLGVRLAGEAGERTSALAEETESGLVSRSGAAPEEDGPVLREELAAVLVRLSGRTVNEAGLFLGGHLPEDAGPDNVLWTYIADAVTEGLPETYPEGVYRAYGWLYATWGDGTLIRDMDWGVWTFGVDGAYTTGNEELDGYLRHALEVCGADELTGEEALRAAYLYVKDIGEYLVRPEDVVLETGATGWEYERALRFFRYGGGTCYGYAAAFGLLARALGKTAYVVAGEVNQFYGAHAFVVIPEEGTDWVYDVELEDTRPERHGDLELFGIPSHGYYNYWYISVWA